MYYEKYRMKCLKKYEHFYIYKKKMNIIVSYRFCDSRKITFARIAFSPIFRENVFSIKYNVSDFRNTVSVSFRQRTKNLITSLKTKRYCHERILYSACICVHELSALGRQFCYAKFFVHAILWYTLTNDTNDDTDKTPFSDFLYFVLVLIVSIQVFKTRFTRHLFDNCFRQWTDGKFPPPQIRCATFSLLRMTAPPPCYQPDFLPLYSACSRESLHCLPVEFRIFLSDLNSRAQHHQVIQI